jgi:acetoin utilization deacetylase AcuC-like enzyme
MNKILTGIAYDPVFLKHNQIAHPENAKRLEVIIEGLNQKGLFEQLKHLPSRQAKMDEIGCCHSIDYIKMVKEFCERGGGYLDPDTYTNENSFLAATIAAGSSIDLTNAIINGELKNGFAFIRPPGHHALSNRSMGFCLFGNIAITAKTVINKSDTNKVAIVDIDVHHGNGTQALIGDDPNILFLSTHQYPYYPGTGSIKEIGTGEAEGTIINIPLQVGVGDEGFELVYDKVIIPSLERFKPDLILVSAGYDAHWDDPLANLNLSLSGYNWISWKLINIADSICSGKIIFFLEGGYNLDVLSNGVCNTIRALLNLAEFEDPLGISSLVEPDINWLVDELIKIHKL